MRNQDARDQFDLNNAAKHAVARGEIKIDHRNVADVLVDYCDLVGFVCSIIPRGPSHSGLEIDPSKYRAHVRKRCP